MKKPILVLSVILCIVSLMAFTSGDSSSPMDASGGPAGYAGDPAGGNKTCGSGGGCHTGAPIGTLTGAITSNIPGTGYLPSTTYTITANIVRAGHSKFGFQITPQKSTGTQLGTMAVTSTQTKLVGSNKYITHTSSGTSGSGSKTWSFKWTSPATGQGPVTFYGVFNCTNNNGNTSGDSIFKSTMVVTENTTAIQPVNAVEFSFAAFPNPTTDIITTRFNLSAPSSIAMYLYDSNGNLIRNFYSADAPAGEMNTTLNLSSYPQGVYFIRVITNGDSMLHKIMKL